MNLKMRLVTGLLIALAVAQSHSQTVNLLAQVKTVYVERFEEGDEAEPQRQSLIKRLARSGRYQVADTAQAADAIVHASGEVWLKGYISVNSRTPTSDRQAVYSGYLSVDLVSRNGEPLWSYLVTPSKITFLRVRDDLANNLVKQMVSASGKNSGQTSANPGAPAVEKLQQTVLVGAGATFPAPLYRKWFASFQRLHPEVQIRYKEIGSEAGVAALQAGTVDFAASDLPAGVDGLADAKTQRIASVLGAVVPAYHLDGLDRDLHFTPDVLAGIYLGDIRKWNDPAIQNLNKDVDLPAADIVVIHRSDGSGTTYAWSSFLSMTNAKWKIKLGAGTRLNWPTGTGVEGNEKMATAVLDTPNSLGYVELVFAIQHHLSFGAVRNRAGEFAHADLDSLAEAARPGADVSSRGPITSILNAPGKEAYPITAFTWLVVPAEEEDAAKRSAMASLLKWILVEGQRECSSLGYAPLPRDKAEDQVRALLQGLPSR